MRDAAAWERVRSPQEVESAFGRAVLDEVARASGGYSYFDITSGEPRYKEICARVANEVR